MEKSDALQVINTITENEKKKPLQEKMIRHNLK